MLKIFMTGDNHIGLKYTGHQMADVIIEKRISAFKDMVSAANTEECDLFIIAGDLFDNTRSIAKRDIRTVFDILSDFMGTVVLLPGNHDFYDAETKLWKEIEDILNDKHNILVLKEYHTYELNINDEKVVLYPALCKSLHSDMGKNNLDWIKNENIIPDSAYRIGIAHGAIEGETIDREGEYFLMTRDELLRLPLDLWILGHTHVPFPKALRESEYTVGERIFNAGTHVQTNVSCNTDGECFIIEIESGEGLKEVRAKKFVSGNINFVRKKLTVKADKMQDILHNELLDIGDNSVVDIIIDGAVSASEYDERVSIIEAELDRFLESSYNDSNLTKLITEDIIKTEFDETSFSARLLNSLLDNSKETQMMYELLKEVREEK